MITQYTRPINTALLSLGCLIAGYQELGAVLEARMNTA